MKKDIVIPQMGESISEATIGEIFKPSGSFVKQDDEILELETDKVNQVIYAPAAGVIELSVSAGDTVTIDQKIGSIDCDKAPPEDEPDEEDAEEEEPPKKEPPKEEGKGKSPESNQSSARESSARESKEEYIDKLKSPSPKPAAKTPSKPLTPSVKSEIPGASRKKMSRLRQTIAERLVQAKTETAMLTTFNEVDLTEVMALRDRFKETFQKKYNLKMGFMPFFVLATLSALKEFPMLNAHIEGDEIVEIPDVNMGIAVSTEKGLVVPVITEVNRLSFGEIEQAIASLAERARDGALTVDEIRGGTFTITNGGAFGSLLSTPILNFPQSGILGMHTIQKRPVVIDDEIKIRSMMYLALTYDHRLVDGREAVLFLKHIKGLLEEPGRFMIGV